MELNTFINGAVVASLISGSISLITYLCSTRKRDIEFAQRQLEFEQRKQEFEQREKDNWRDILVSRIANTEWKLEARKIAYREYLSLGYNGSIARQYQEELGV